MKKILIILVTIVVSTITANSQNEVDALRYSMYDIQGSARYSSMGGAFGSLGGEFSGISSNPAGIGMYQFSEISFTPCLNLNMTKSYYNNSHISSYKSTSDIGSLGLVMTMPKKESDWRRINIGIGWNKLADYNQNIKIEGVNENNSIVDRFIDLTQGSLMDELINGQCNTYSQMSWNTYLIDPLYENNQIIDGEYTSNLSSASRIQVKSTATNGGLHEFVLSLGGSYKDKLYIGATLGFPTIDN